MCDHLEDDDHPCRCGTAGEPVPVRIVRGDPYAGRDGETRLRFEVCVLKVLIALYVLGAVLR